MVKVTGKSKSPIAGRPRVDAHDGLEAGDLVSLRDEPGRFKVLSIALNDDGTAAWVDLYGGDGYPSNHERVYASCRSVLPERILRSASSGEPERVDHGRRDPGLLAELMHELARDGKASRPAPDDQKLKKSLQERMYTAARKLEMKIRVRTVDGLVVACVKDES